MEQVQKPAHFKGFLGESIFLELEWLHLLADDGPVSGDFAQILLRSRVWRIVHPRPRYMPRTAVAIVATTALFPEVVNPVVMPEAAAQATERMVLIRVVDATTNKPLVGARLVIPGQGSQLTTDEQGRAAVPIDDMPTTDVRVEKEGYRPFPLVFNQLRPGRVVFIGLARQSLLGSPQAPTRAPGPPDLVVTAITPSPPAHRPTQRPRVEEGSSPLGKPPALAHPTAKPKPQSQKPAVEKPTPRKIKTPGSRWTPVPVTDHESALPETHVAEPTVAHAGKSQTRIAAGVAPAFRHKRLRTLTVKARPSLDTTHTTAPERPGSHRVFPGDTLWEISARHYGDGRFWPTIFQANRRIVRDPDLIWPGQLLDIPAARLAGAGSRRTHIVKAGDTLWNIAGRRLGDPRTWVSIYHLNSNIVADPNRIFGGQVLRLPRFRHSQ